jgi:predicted aspartyl protease
MTPRGGQPVTFYLDKTTYLPVRQEVEKKGQTYTTFFSDWRDVNGLKVPFKLRETTGDPRNETITTILEAHFNIPLSGKIFAKPQQTTVGVRFTQGRSASHIPFKLFNNEILFEMRVNNSAPLLALFDTGASISLIDSQRANSLGLNSQGELGASAQGGTVSVALINGVTFNFPGAHISDRTVASTSLEPIEEGLGRKIDLVLGSDVIKRFVVEVDYANKLLKLHDPGRYRYTGRGQSIPLTIDKIPFVNAKIATAQGTFVEGRFLIDTGADGTVELNRPFVEANRLLNNQKTIEASGAGLGGTQKTLVGRAKALQLGGFKLNNILVTFLQDSEGAGADSDSAGLIGSEILGRFKVIFNYQRQQMILERSARFNEPYDRDMSGVELKSVDLSPKAFQITKVVKDSPADRAGLQEGDFIISVDGKDAALFDLNAINKMFKREGLDISLAIRRGEKALEVRLKLKRMI